MNFFKKPLVSVILASYNHVDFIERAVKSVLNQTVSNLELLVVDDGSTDGTLEVVESIKDSRIRLVKLKENRAIHPRNLALSMSDGKYIAFQNSDDEWDETKLEKQLMILEKNPNLVAYFTAVKIINDKGKVQPDTWAKDLFTSENRTQAEWLKHFFDYGNCLAISSSVVRNNLIKKINGFRESLIQLSDFDLWVRLAGMGDFNILPEPLSKIRIIGNKNLSAPSKESLRRSQFELAEVLERYLEEPVSNNLKKAFMSIGIPDNSLKLTEAIFLIKYGWKLNTAHHRLFANNSFTKLIDDKRTRNQIVKIFGADIIRQYIHNKSTIEYLLNTSV